jgi:hypothetical protein
VGKLGKEPTGLDKGIVETPLCGSLGLGFVGKLGKEPTGPRLNDVLLSGQLLLEKIPKAWLVSLLY